MFELRVGQAADKGMDWLQWSSSIVSSVAWPIAAFAIAYIFRSQIAALLKKVRKLSWGDKTVDFSDELDKIEEVARETMPDVADVADQQIALPDPRLQQLLALSPSAAIVEAWKPIERKLTSIYRIKVPDHSDVNGKSRSQNAETRMMHVISALQSWQLIDRDTQMVLNDLRRLRNTAAHFEDVTASDALRFIDLAGTVMRELEKI